MHVLNHYDELLEDAKQALHSLMRGVLQGTLTTNKQVKGWWHAAQQGSWADGIIRRRRRHVRAADKHAGLEGSCRVGLLQPCRSIPAMPLNGLGAAGLHTYCTQCL